MLLARFIPDQLGAAVNNRSPVFLGVIVVESWVRRRLAVQGPPFCDKASLCKIRFTKAGLVELLKKPVGARMLRTT